MSVSVGYKQNRLLISSLKCSCGCHHNAPTQDVYVGTSLIPKLPAYIRRRELGEKLVLVADQTTYAVAGEKVEAALAAKGFEVKRCVLKREGKLEPDEAAVGEVLMAMTMETEFFVSVGSGTVTDITRTVAAQTERPFVAVATAPSMDGYTSTVAPMLLRGVKIHIPAVCPEIILCDLDVLRTAPLPMFAAGVGDVLGKYIAKADWSIGHIVNGENCCPACTEIVMTAARRLLDNVDEIASRSEKGAKVLIEALLLSGMTVMVIGNTRAVASVEHNAVHYWEMRQLLAGKKVAPHGLAVGVSTLMLWPIYEAFADLDPAAFSLEKALSAKPDRAERERFLVKQYGEEAARAIIAENEADFLSDEELTRRFEAIKARFAQIRDELRELPPRDRIAQALQRLGAPLKPEEIGIDEALRQGALRCAKDYRARYTLLKTIAELGLEPFGG